MRWVARSPPWWQNIFGPTSNFSQVLTVQLHILCSEPSFFLFISLVFFCWRRNVIQYVFLFNTICREWLLGIQMLAGGVGSHWILPRVKRQKDQPAIHPSIQPYGPLSTRMARRWMEGGSRKIPRVSSREGCISQGPKWESIHHQGGSRYTKWLHNSLFYQFVHQTVDANVSNNKLHHQRNEQILFCRSWTEVFLVFYNVFTGFTTVQCGAFRPFLF